MPRHPQSPRVNRFSQRLNGLFEERLVPGSNPPRPWTLTEVAEKTGLSVGYLSRARLGGIDYPGRDKLKALADFFQVHVDYFTQERDAAAEAALLSPGMIESLRRPEVRRVLLRAGELGDEELELMQHLMDYAQGLSKQRKVADEGTQYESTSNSPDAPGDH